MSDIRKINQDGIDLLLEYEGCRLESYLCPAGVWTIGYGHTGPDVKWGMKITESEAERFLLDDLEKFCAGVEKLVKSPLTDNQFSALVSFCFNVGKEAFRKSTLLKKINEGKFIEATQEFPRWNKANGKVIPGLIRRRAAEQALFIK